MPKAAHAKRMKIRLNMYAVIDGNGEIVTSGMDVKSCRGGPALKREMLDQVTARKTLFRACFNLDGMKPGTRKEVTNG